MGMELSNTVRNVEFKLSRLIRSSVMVFFVTCSTEGSQVLFRIIASLATEKFVVNFQIRHRAARLASPSVSLEHLIPKLLISLRTQPHGGAFWKKIHDIFSLC